MAETDVIRRSMTTGVTGPLRLLEALRWPSPLGPALRFWFGRGATPEQVRLPRRAEIRIGAAMQVGPSLIVNGSGGPPEGVMHLAVRAGPLTVDPPQPETGLFRGMNMLCGERHREPAETVVDWMRFHARHHGAEGAVILDRAPPGEERGAFAKGLRRAGLHRVCVVTSALPLGQPGQPALGDPATAPRASGPGTALPDPWYAPMAEPVLYDALRWRFLGEAGVVVSLNPSELLMPAGVTVFDLARRSDRGAVKVDGEAIYPWRIRKGRAAGHGDHICRAEPPEALSPHWAVEPARCAPENLWLSEGVTRLPMAAVDARFHRCMGLVFPDSPVRDLIARSELTEDPALVDRAGTLGARPVRPPAQPAPGVRARQATGRTVIVTCMKNEGPFVLEWIAYHRMIGVDDVLVYTNDCTDGTDTLLDLLQARGLVTRRDNPFRGTGQRLQHAALSAARAEPVVRDAGWILPIDVDEFVNIHVGDGHLDDLRAAVPEADLVSLTWRLFGDSDQGVFEDRPVTARFTRCAPQLIRRPHQAWGFKTLFRNAGLFADLGVHRPKGLDADAAVMWVNGSGKPMPRSILRSGWRSNIDSYGYDLVTLNHYAVRDAESFLVKRDRGRVNHVARDQGEAYWFRMNNNAEADRSIQRHLPGLTAAIDALLADPEIAAAHAASVAAHRARIAALLATPDYRALCDLIVSDRMRKLSRLHHRFGVNVFLAGPSVVPDSLLQEDVPPETFFNVARPDGPAAH